jgi:hypothetical protein
MVHIRDVTIDFPKSTQAQMNLVAVLRMLLHPERLAINGSALSWSYLLPELASCIYDLISLPSLDRLHLLRIGPVPPSLILHAVSSVRVLSLNHIIADPHGVRASPATDIVIKLEELLLPTSLTTDITIRACNFLLRMPQLHRLAICPGTRTDGQCYKLMKALSATLRHLEIYPGGETIVSPSCHPC